jgi:hypothetical protein
MDGLFGWLKKGLTALYWWMGLWIGLWLGETGFKDSD